MKDRFWLRIIIIISSLISGAVLFLILGPRPAGFEQNLDVSFLPAINASLNALTTVLLLVGYTLIRRKKQKLHMTVMLTSFATSSAFLISYVIYHWFKSGPKLYTGEWKSFYLSVLLSHILLAVIIIPLALITLYHGWNKKIKKHRYIARITLPLWLYVSITGVIIYSMLY